MGSLVLQEMHCFARAYTKPKHQLNKLKVQSLYFLCPSSSSSHPELQTPLSSKEVRPFYPSEEVTDEAPGFYTANSHQYQDTEL